jgi:serine/threonine protein kinase
MHVCHRDLKAANIFMNNGQPKIADFGLAKIYKYYYKISREKFKDLDIGSPLYMSPEGLNYNVYG